MLSLPENWEFSIAGLSKTSGEGKDSIRAGVKELEGAGYLTRKRKHLANGRLGEMEYTIYEEPINVEPAQETSALESPAQEIPTQEETTQGKPTEINKEYKQELNIKRTERERKDSTVVYQPLLPNSLSLLSDRPTAVGAARQTQATMFNRFWESYPRRSNKLKAMLAWNALPVDSELYDNILLAVEKFKKSRQWQDKLYVPYPETFLTQRRWEDEIPEDEPPRAAKKNNVAKAVNSVLAKLEAMGDDEA